MVFFAGGDFVLMRDAYQVWKCLEDKCSHRLGFERMLSMTVSFGKCPTRQFTALLQE